MCPSVYPTCRILGFGRKVKTLTAVGGQAADYRRAETRPNPEFPFIFTHFKCVVFLLHQSTQVQLNVSTSKHDEAASFGILNSRFVRSTVTHSVFGNLHFQLPVEALGRVQLDVVLHPLLPRERFSRGAEISKRLRHDGLEVSGNSR